MITVDDCAYLSIQNKNKKYHGVQKVADVLT